METCGSGREGEGGWGGEVVHPSNTPSQYRDHARPLKPIWYQENRQFSQDRQNECLTSGLRPPLIYANAVASTLGTDGISPALVSSIQNASFIFMFSFLLAYFQACPNTVSSCGVMLIPNLIVCLFQISLCVSNIRRTCLEGGDGGGSVRSW
jgi:hypothetical protein